MKRILTKTDMLIDIHTHHYPPKSYPAIYNLTFEMAEEILSTKEKGLFSTGIHPWYAHECSEEKMLRLEKWLNDEQIIAIGECGLDKHAKATLKEQHEIFERQIIISEQLQKPLIIHCVGCFNELLQIRKQLIPKQLWIIHGFRGKPQLTEQLLCAGCTLSFGEKFNSESVRVAPLDRLFTETDKSNEPIEAICRRIADVKKCTVDDLSVGKEYFFR